MGISTCEAIGGGKVRVGQDRTLSLKIVMIAGAATKRQADRHRSNDEDGYCTGLTLSIERKSVEPIAAAIDPDNVSARHLSLLHFVAEAPWPHAALLELVETRVDAALGDAPRYWLVDDTGSPKKGNHSVGVAQQHCAQLGKQDNCQMAVSVSLAT